LINPDGTLQEAGSFIHESGYSLQVGRVGVYHPGEELEWRVVDYCSAACLAVPKAIFRELGGFDPVFCPAYFEDVDLCFRIAATGKFVVYCPASTVMHLKNITAAQIWTPGEMEKIIEANRLKFLSRWGEWLQSRADNHEISFPTRTFETSPGKGPKR
jgi:GT2 family glycosyltransferase